MSRLAPPPANNPFKMLSTDDKIAEIRRLYFSATAKTIQQDLEKALADTDPRLQTYGIQRTVRDALHIDGRVAIGPDGQVEQVILNGKHPLATAFHDAYSR